MIKVGMIVIYRQVRYGSDDVLLPAIVTKIVENGVLLALFDPDYTSPQHLYATFGVGPREWRFPESPDKLPGEE